MKVLIVHNQLWAHYKAIVFNELQTIISQNKNNSFLVVQIASIEKSRQDLGDLDDSIHKYPYQLIHKGLLEDVNFYQRVNGILKAVTSFKPDVVNLTGYYDVAFWVVLFFCKMKGIKTVLSNESTANDHSRNGIKEYIKMLIIKQFNGYFNFGTLSEKYLLSLGINPEKMLVKRNCVDNAMLKSIYSKYLSTRNEQQQFLEIPPKNFIFVGRIIDYKNLFLFVEAFNVAQHQSKENWGVIILGDGELKTELQQFVSENKIQNINFQNGVSWQRVPQYLALSDVLVLASYSEPWGLVVNEAMACGLPVIVSEKCGCAIDLVKNGENGFTFAPHDSNKLVDLLLKFMNKEVDSEQMGIVSERIIEEYSPTKVAHEMYEGFHSIFHNQ